MTPRRFGRGVGFAALIIAILPMGVWASAALWYRCGCEEPMRGVLGSVAAVCSIATVALLFGRWRWKALAAYSVALVVVLGWWSAISPAMQRDWAPDVARAVTATVDGDRVVVSNVRNFAWRSENDFDPVWEQRSYVLSRLGNVDLIMSYWMGEAVAHTIVSFGFDDRPRLAFSIETRKEANETYSSIAGFFKQYELAIIAADERDVVRLRSNIRGEDVRIYRLRMTPANAQRLFRLYLEEANELAKQPRFYNTLTANCTTLVFDLVQVIHPGLPFDLRVILSGYLPDYAYSVGALNTSVPFESLRDLARIHDKAILADADPRFSTRIREGIPSALSR